MDCAHELMVDTASIYRQTGMILPIYGGDTLGNEWRYFKCLCCGQLVREYTKVRGEAIVQGRRDNKTLA